MTTNPQRKRSKRTRPAKRRVTTNVQRLPVGRKKTVLDRRAKVSVAMHRGGKFVMETARVRRVLRIVRTDRHAREIAVPKNGRTRVIVLRVDSIRSVSREVRNPREMSCANCS